ncbi:hypothetical protein ACOSQ3_006980 [Xanthoceras sorbifolium]
MIPAEAIVSTHRISTFDPEQNNDLLAINLYLIEEKMDTARLRVDVYQQKVARYYNRKVKLRQFNKGDIVLRLILPGARNPREGALGPNWEGPYMVDKDLENGTYHLVNVNGARVP